MELSILSLPISFVALAISLASYKHARKTLETANKPLLSIWIVRTTNEGTGPSLMLSNKGNGPARVIDVIDSKENLHNLFDRLGSVGRFSHYAKGEVTVNERIVKDYVIERGAEICLIRFELSGKDEVGFYLKYERAEADIRELSFVLKYQSLTGRMEEFPWNQNR